MSDLSELEPKKRHRIMDLVEEAGVDVRDWANIKRGTKWAAANPKYCYEWAFIQAGKLVVLNLWFDLMRNDDSANTFQSVNYREFANQQRHLDRVVVAERADRMDRVIREAFLNNLPVRVVVCDGYRRASEDPTKVSRVSKRLLDPVAWSVTSYDTTTGAAVLTRGLDHDYFVDQFSLPNSASSPVERYTVSGEVFKRSPEVRKQVLTRANGRCESCDQPGFKMSDGRVYLETHHIIPLCEGGQDSDLNVAALCPNHHREAHHGAKKSEIRESLRVKLGGVI
jgi:5-methylcytosine-specific restriction protein A